MRISSPDIMTLPTCTLSGIAARTGFTITGYDIDWGDGIGFASGVSPGAQTYTYAGTADSSTDYTITVHVLTADGVYVSTATKTITVNDTAPVVTVDDP